MSAFGIGAVELLADLGRTDDRPDDVGSYPPTPRTPDVDGRASHDPGAVTGPETSPGPSAAVAGED